MNSGLAALGRGFAGAFHPRMLLLTLMALSAAVALWFFAIWELVDPLLQWVHQFAFSDGQMPEVVNTLSGFGGAWIKSILVPVIVFFVLWPLVASTAVILASVIVMPFVISHVSKNRFPNLAKAGTGGFFGSLWQALKASLVFVVGWLVTLPLWLVPGVAFFLPFFWTAYLLVAVMSFDCLIEHASADEFKRIYKDSSGGAWWIGLACAALSVVPPLFLLVPVISALAFTHYYLEKLQALRENDRTWQQESV
ncbi:MAG: EI24 domain-containing protein [Burkholderiales bacterium]|jgi:uncharacterized protein involved in cysteine biosynthesis|nr:EI24 domain-containing protein [Burkholderiales bacterium]